MRCTICGTEVESRWDLWEVTDARGIYCGRVCSDKCEEALEARFRPEVMTNPNYYADEPIEPEEW